MATEISRAQFCFLALPADFDETPVAQTIRKAIADARFRLIRPSENSTGRADSVSRAIARADCIVIDLTDSTPTRFFEIGLAQALGKAIFVITQDKTPLSLVTDVAWLKNVIQYEADADGLRRLGRALIAGLREFSRFPRGSRALLGARSRNLFAVDWERLNPRDLENLCVELLTQMGFRRVEWEKESREIDIVAELPKKDPDGFEYRELWLVSLGLNVAPEMLLEMFNHDPEYFARRMLRFNDKFSPLLRRQRLSDVPITFLLVNLGDISIQQELFQSEERATRKISSANSLRLRIWDRNYLAGLVYQFPQIGFKYFSDEGRAKSKYRKTPEQLYQENLELTERLTANIVALNDEKNKRVRAERDAVWKDISFSAAHKMGNPIFAIETYLDPLKKRINEDRTDEAVGVVDDIRSSVEKAKAIIAQFKSLTLAQKIRPIPTLLEPLLRDACLVAANKGVICSIECPKDLAILGDPERLAECFDELVRNALHWFDKPERVISVTVSTPESNSLAEQLDSNMTYALIHFRDNGPGVAIANKTKIFDAFFSTYHHGTGLGLALVRRIIEGHGGAVTECGSPGEGADFEIYLQRTDSSPQPVLASTDDSETVIVSN